MFNFLDKMLVLPFLIQPTFRSLGNSRAVPHGASVLLPPEPFELIFLLNSFACLHLKFLYLGNQLFDALLGLHIPANKFGH